MNKAITEGLVFMPPPFSGGLDVWSAGDGIPGSDTYDIIPNGIYVAADSTFAGCLEVLKTETVAKVRYTGETQILPGCYLQIRAKVKAVSGPLPAVRIAGWAGKPNGAHLGGVTEVGPSTQLTDYGEVVEVTAIVGTGDRQGVDMVWTGAAYGHFGIDITGPNSAVVRVDDIEIEDVTGYFLRDLMAIVDVRDYGAKGDGSTDDSAAFEAADADAGDRTVHVPAGTYFLNNHVTMESRVSFEGTIAMPADKRFILQKNFDFDAYYQAFKNEELAFRKAYQALLNAADHESLDLCGRRIAVFSPIDMQAAEGEKTSFAQRRVIRNGQILAASTGDWDDITVTAQASYSASNNLKLTNVQNISAIPVGSLVTGNGVGREVYVAGRDIANKTLTLNTQLFDAAGTQTFTFRRFRYILDFSGYDSLSLFSLDDIEFQCQGLSSAIMLARGGLTFHVRDCFITRPKDRGITSPSRGCQGLQVDRCQFLSDESGKTVSQRKSICLNAAANDVKLRQNRVVHFKHFAILGGTGSLIEGNHYFHGDGTTNGIRKGGIIFTSPNLQSIITGNYIDNNFIELTNEHDATPDFGNQYSFGGLTITGNTFVVIDVAPWFNWLVIKPYGSGHFIHGLSVTGNSFRTLNCTIDRIESVDTTYADLNFSRMRNVEFRGNTYHGVTDETLNPVSVTHTQHTAARHWNVGAYDYLPFGGRPRVIESVVAEDGLKNGSGSERFPGFYVRPDHEPSNKKFRITWSENVKGRVRCMVRMDNPI
ncbi:glycosyl hydrolase family 28-related protein [Pelagovum pacificum]|uniref:Right-handed parallel beta-helix repeat-containing protein n=1 Tax=Pelagovum pacificum TaxID=2588711 RepID=A0A5C5G9B0_9RHOB|nr:glycosyl hydrolase family 28-related protein [Pelagovum pacificum]QQA42229.1 right-handed parallel beta-helix repeat-containing protein [Pelagovum pacificum]TNY31315.1 right-handed parallel beta-helix repeat-containing protein [Pelagovum pacificum]